ncbi:MAG: hypothetical protein Q9213_007028 [Squamulea squamosa]
MQTSTASQSADDAVIRALRRALISHQIALNASHKLDMDLQDGWRNVIWAGRSHWRQEYFEWQVKRCADILEAKWNWSERLRVLEPYITRLAVIEYVLNGTIFTQRNDSNDPPLH